MNSAVVPYTAAVLMAFVAVACTGVCLAWSVPAWRRRLGRRSIALGLPAARGMSGWPARVGSGVVSAGVAACAAVGWYGCYFASAGLFAAR